MLTDWGRRNFKVVLEPVAGVLRQWHLTPNTITLIGLILSSLAAYLILSERILAAGLVYVIAASADAIDGTLARQLGSA